MPPHADAPGLRQRRTTAQPCLIALVACLATAVPAGTAAAQAPAPSKAPSSRAPAPSKAPSSRAPAPSKSPSSRTPAPSPPASSKAPSTGGAASGPTPAVRRVKCRKLCAGALPRPGSTVAFEGSGLRDVVSVEFLGARAAGDEVTAKPYRTSPRRTLVVVPAGARRGRAVLTDAEGATSKPSPVVRVMRRAKPKPTGGPVATAVTGRKAFFDGEQQPTLTFSLTAGRPARVLVQVVRAADGGVVAAFDQGTVQPGEERSVSWDGLVAGRPAPDGRYGFVVQATDLQSGTVASSAQAPTPRPEEAFTLLGHRFPVRGKHHYGEYAASFGGGRGHKGHDVFAACGTPLVAARGGIVKMKRFQSRAGNYVVIDGEGTDVDMAYMHLRDPALVEQRERVHTGQLIGYVGDTGRASGCHLHFEMWSGPGWYTGGSPFDPLPSLKAWDAVS